MFKTELIESSDRIPDALPFFWALDFYIRVTVALAHVEDVLIELEAIEGCVRDFSFFSFFRCRLFNVTLWGPKFVLNTGTLLLFAYT